MGEIVKGNEILDRWGLIINNDKKPMIQIMTPSSYQCTRDATAPAHQQQVVDNLSPSPSRFQKT